MKIAVSSKSADPGGAVDARFGRARFFLVHDTETGGWEGIENAFPEGAAHGDGAGVRAAEMLSRLGVCSVIGGHICTKAYAMLAARGLTMYFAHDISAAQAVPALQRGELPELTASSEE